MAFAVPTLLDSLRAAAEPSRLRLMAVLAQGEHSVSELTEILGQSQPRVSRHLRILDDAGLLERFREQHWVCYRVPVEGEGGRLARLLLDQLDPGDPTLLADAERVRAVRAARHERGAPTGEEALGASAQALVPVVAAELGTGGVDALLYRGRAPDELLPGIAPRARRVLGLAASRQLVQRARAVLHSAGLHHCVLQQADLAAMPIGAGGFDVAVLDRTLAGFDRPAEVLRVTARMLRPGGRLLVIEDFDALEREARDGNALAQLRAWFADAGLACERLRPCDVRGGHVLLASASVQPGLVAA